MIPRSGVGDRPNILLVMADQLAAPLLSAYGGPAITPAIDRLAAAGQPATDARNQYMRNHLDLNEVETRRRLACRPAGGHGPQ